MHRVPLVCHDHDDRHPYAPFLTADISIAGTSATVAFLVDTGADHTVLDPYRANLPRTVFRQGRRERSAGVGGRWPSRRFVDRSHLVLLAEDEGGHEELVRIALPSVSVLAPFGRLARAGTGPEVREDLGPYAPTDRRLRTGEIVRCHEITPLLGRDVFHANGLRLKWDPNGRSAIGFGEPSTSLGRFGWEPEDDDQNL